MREPDDTVEYSQAFTKALSKLDSQDRTTLQAVLDVFHHRKDTSMLDLVNLLRDANDGVKHAALICLYEEKI